ncbi:MAG: hypothetical protein M3Y87_31080 [Myxococcota bacterium]|nr:hypothetical protein [Myxococcota bacterium]
MALHRPLPLPLPLALAVVILLGVSSAGAQEPTLQDEQARTHFQSGRLYFDRAQYDDALREFEAAYDLSHRAALLYNIYLTYERLGRYGQAADRLEQFLRDDPSIEDDQRATYEARIANLRERATAAAAPTPMPEPQPEPAPVDEGGLSPLGIAGIATLGAGAASLIVFAITGGMALGEDASLADRCGASAGRTCTEEDVSGLRTLTTVADVTWVAGLVLAAAGATLLAIDLTSDRSGETARISVAPMMGPGFAGAMIGGRL